MEVKKQRMQAVHISLIKAAILEESRLHLLSLSPTNASDLHVLSPVHWDAVQGNVKTTTTLNAINHFYTIPYQGNNFRIKSS